MEQNIAVETQLLTFEILASKLISGTQRYKYFNLKALTTALNCVELFFTLTNMVTRCWRCQWRPSVMVKQSKVEWVQQSSPGRQRRGAPGSRHRFLEEGPRPLPPVCPSPVCSSCLVWTASAWQLQVGQQQPPFCLITEKQREDKTERRRGGGVDQRRRHTQWQ